MTKQHEAFPTLLNKSDAMMNAAEYLERQVSNLRLLNAMSNVFSKIKPEEMGDKPETKDAIEEMRASARGIVDVEIQAKAMTDAAKEIRAMANEMKLIDARQSSGSIVREIAR